MSNTVIYLLFLLTCVAAGWFFGVGAFVGYLLGMFGTYRGLRGPK